jgi:hypothetical protein
MKEYNDLTICACMGPQGEDPVCPCAMLREGKHPSYRLWTTTDEKALIDALRQIFEKKT